MSKEVLLASCGNDVKLFSLPNYKFETSFAAHNGLTADIAWNFDNSVIYSIGNNDILSATYISKLISDRKYKEHSTKISHNKICCTQISNGLYSTGSDGMCLQWDIKALAPKKAFKCLNSNPNALIFNQNEDRISIGMSSNHHGNAIQMFDVHSSASQTPIIFKLPSTEGVESIQFSPFMINMMGCTTNYGSLHLWDVNNQTIIRTFLNDSVDKDIRCGLAFSPINEKLVTSITCDGRLQMHDILQYSLINSSQITNKLTSISFFCDGATIAVGTKKGKIFIFDLRMALLPLHRLSGHAVGVTKVLYQTNIESYVKTSKLFAQIQYKNAEMASKVDAISNVDCNQDYKKIPPSPSESSNALHVDKVHTTTSLERIFINPNESYSLYSPVKNENEALVDPQSKLSLSEDNLGSLQSSVTTSVIESFSKNHITSSTDKPSKYLRSSSISCEFNSSVKRPIFSVSDVDQIEITKQLLLGNNDNVSLSFKKLLESFIHEQRIAFTEMRDQIHQTQIFFNTEIAKMIHSQNELKKMVISLLNSSKNDIKNNLSSKMNNS